MTDDIYAEVRARAERNRAERAAREAADPEYVDYQPKCDLCGGDSDDLNQVVDLYENSRSVACVHWDGCRYRLPAWKSDFDGSPIDARTWQAP